MKQIKLYVLAGDFHSCQYWERENLENLEDHETVYIHSMAQLRRLRGVKYVVTKRFYDVYNKDFTDEVDNMIQEREFINVSDQFTST